MRVYCTKVLLSTLFYCYYYNAGMQIVESLTVGNICDMLANYSEKWMKIADLLVLDESQIVKKDVINSILVLRCSDKESLRRVVEWWFMNTANPEWSTIKNLFQGKNLSILHAWRNMHVKRRM